MTVSEYLDFIAFQATCKARKSIVMNCLLPAIQQVFPEIRTLTPDEVEFCNTFAAFRLKGDNAESYEIVAVACLLDPVSLKNLVAQKAELRERAEALAEIASLEDRIKILKKKACPGELY